jgi:hypothetical protein
MRVTINITSLLFEVRMSALDKGAFAHMLDTFKACIPQACRAYRPDGKYWSVAKRSHRHLETFCQMMREAGAVVVREGETVRAKPPQARPAQNIIPSPALGYLLVDVEAEPDGADLVYQAEQKRQGRAAVILTKGPRLASLRAVMADGVLTDMAKRQIFESLCQGTLPGGSVRVSNRLVNATKLSIGFARQAAGWLGAVMNHPSNKNVGDSGREHARLEAERRLDGSIKMIQGAGHARRKAA